MADKSKLISWEGMLQLPHLRYCATLTTANSQTTRAASTHTSNGQTHMTPRQVPLSPRTTTRANGRSQDWARLRKIVAPTLRIDYRSFLNKIWEEMPADDFVAMASDPHVLGDKTLKTVSISPLHSKQP